MVLAPSTDLWNSLFTLYSVAALLVSGVVFAFFVYLMVKYRARPDAPEPADAPRIAILPERGTVKMAVVLMVLLTGLFFGLTIQTFSAVDFYEHIPEDYDLRIQVLAFQWGWRFEYPNGRILTGELRVPQDAVVVLDITSNDVFHTFGMPEFKIKKDAIPGRVNSVWFQAQQVGVYEGGIRCYELCGVGHAEMLADLLVMQPEGFESWYGEGG